ncbi:uncharacterized protein VTP21DRAFT_6109 [Calcarisporiella thermophila]|uniref:uncharacterized protein n=1 Tax=Calcarisporiella thermophila TaxID=911321 RepID=UPI003743E600
MKFKTARSVGPAHSARLLCPFPLHPAAGVLAIAALSCHFFLSNPLRPFQAPTGHYGQKVSCPRSQPHSSFIQPSVSIDFAHPHHAT